MPKISKKCNSISKSVWEVTDLLADGDVLNETPCDYTSPCGLRHFFVSSKSNFIGQVLFISRHIDRLLYQYHKQSEKGVFKPSELWLHAIGSRAIDRAVQMALHLDCRMYPGHLSLTTHTSKCSTNKELISWSENRETHISEKPQSKSAIHIQIQLSCTRG